jgi:hypothetical protein
LCHLLPTPDPRRTCSVLFSDFVEEKTKEIIRKTAFLLVWDKEIPSIASMHMCIAAHIGSFLPDLFTTS